MFTTESEAGKREKQKEIEDGFLGKDNKIKRKAFLQNLYLNIFLFCYKHLDICLSKIIINFLLVFNFFNKID